MDAEKKNFSKAEYNYLKLRLIWKMMWNPMGWALAIFGAVAVITQIIYGYENLPKYPNEAENSFVTLIVLYLVLILLGWGIHYRRLFRRLSKMRSLSNDKIRTYKEAAGELCLLVKKGE